MKYGIKPTSGHRGGVNRSAAGLATGSPWRTAGQGTSKVGSWHTDRTSRYLGAWEGRFQFIGEGRATGMAARSLAAQGRYVLPAGDHHEGAMAKVTVEIDRKREVEDCYRLWAASLPGTERQLGRPITFLVVGQEVENRIELFFDDNFLPVLR
jgi:hypothetical protein